MNRYMPESRIIRAKKSIFYFPRLSMSGLEKLRDIIQEEKKIRCFGKVCKDKSIPKNTGEYIDDKHEGKQCASDSYFTEVYYDSGSFDYSGEYDYLMVKSDQSSVVIDGYIHTHLLPVKGYEKDYPGLSKEKKIEAREVNVYVSEYREPYVSNLEGVLNFIIKPIVYRHPARLDLEKRIKSSVKNEMAQKV